MNTQSNHSSDQLLAIITMQAEIAKLGPDLFHVMQFVAESSQKMAGGIGAVVELAEADEMVYRSASGSAANMLGLRLKRDSSLSGLCVAMAKPLYCADSETDERVDRDACRKVGVRSMVVVPLIHEGEAIGVLKVLSDRADAFSNSDAELLGMISDLVAATMFFAGKYGMDALFKQATTDYLTQLANRALFYDHLRSEIAKSQREQRPFSIIMLDMDDLKPINDDFGHAAGDEALKMLARRIAGEARQSDTVARLGGDEFAVILSSVEQREQVEAMRKRLAASIASPFHYDGKPLMLAASIGTALYPEDGSDMESLIRAADQAMYSDKRARKGCAAR